MRRRSVAACLLFLAAAAYVVLVELHRAAPFPAFDVYIYFIPNKLHAAYSVWHGGKGLLWNPYQACGEPFFANPATGVLYPPHLLFLVLDPNVAVHVVLVLNMVIGALGMLALARTMGLGATAGLAGALAFELGDGMMELTGWSPMHSGPWAWVPWTLAFAEGLLRTPSVGGVVGLAGALAIGLLPGWVLLIALAYQVIALRVVWELLTRRAAPPWRGVGAVGAGLALAPMLAAVQLLPAAELARESQRVAFDFADFWAYGGLTTDVVASIRQRVPPVPFMAAPLLLAVVAPFTTGHRRLLAFWAVVGVAFAVLALGPATPLFWLYVRLPPGGATLRYPNRLFWITGLSLAVVTALAVDGALRRPGRAALLALAGTVALFLVVPGGLRRPELIALALLAATLGAAGLRPGLARPAACLVVAAVVVDLVATPIRFPGRLLPSARALWQHADAFAALRSRMSAQDRALIASSLSSMYDLGVLTKTATIARIPDVYDYEPLVGHRLGNYYSAMWHGSPIVSGEAVLTAPTVVAGYRSRLSEAAAVRYVVSPATPRFSTRELDLTPIPSGDPGLRLYLTRRALPRARWVPRVEVVHDADALLNRLAYGTDDLAEVGFVEEPFASGFTGTAGAHGAGKVRFVRDDPEHIVLDVDAPARGFVLLADQHAPGWRASVDGAATPIRLANYAFRAIEVPAGRSRVEFRYRPASVAIGAGVSATTLALVLAFVARRRARRTASA